MAFHWELEEAFLWEVALGLVEAEKKRESSSKSHAYAAEDREEPPATSSATAWDS